MSIVESDKKSEEDLNDYEFISKYIRDDSDQDNLKKENENQVFKEKYKLKEQGSTEVFNSIGESEGYSENSNFHKHHNEDSSMFEVSDEKVESIAKPLTSSKKEFIKQLNDDSLTIDTCSKLTHDWGKK
ncbi:MAG: hypothetical protein ABIH37_03305 [archaeon]